MRDTASTVRKNIEACTNAEKTISLIRQAQLSELIYAEGDGLSAEEAAELYCSSFGESPLSADMLYISEHLAKRAKEGSKLPDLASIACLKNPLTLKALKELTEGIQTVRLAEQADFRASCEAVASDSADYCILPVCSSVDGHYPTFSKLTKTYELKIVRERRLSKPDSDEEIQFALLSKKLEIHHGASSVSFSFTEEDKDTLPRLITALFSGGIEIKGVNSSPLEYNMDRLEHRIEVSLGKVFPEAFFFFLDATLPGHTVLGVY